MNLEQETHAQGLNQLLRCWKHNCSQQDLKCRRSDSCILQGFLLSDSLRKGSQCSREDVVEQASKEKFNNPLGLALNEAFSTDERKQLRQPGS